VISRTAKATIILLSKALLVPIIVPVTRFLVTVSLAVTVNVPVTVTVTLIETLIILVSIIATPTFTVVIIVTVGRVFCVVDLYFMTLLIILTFALGLA
jgi:hypothetical protein